MDMELAPNEGKQGVTMIDGVSYQRLPIKTHLITNEDDIVAVAEQYGKPVLEEADDVLFISEKCVACAQGRAIPLVDIKPRKLAVWLSNHVTKTPHGIGLGMISYTAVMLFTGKGKEVSPILYVIAGLFIVMYLLMFL